ncbi:MAG: hypothetical protein GQ574_27250 [Crocinitomix sp.]|nr:hypothetical protein [Crocinitomix sp.]
MLLRTPCKSCNEPMEKAYPVHDRIAFAQKYGEQTLLTCHKCGADHQYFPDEFKAVNDVKVRSIAFASAIVLSIICGFIGLTYLSDYKFTDRILSYLIFAAPLALFVLFIKSDTSAIRLFNRVKLKGHNVNSKIRSTSSKVRIAAVDNTVNTQTDILQQLPTDRKESQGKE